MASLNKYLMTTTARRVAALVVVIVWQLAGPLVALAHAQLVRSDPAYGAVLAAPQVARLWYSERLDPSFSEATLLDPHGATIPTPSPSAIAPDDPAELTLPLPTLAPGIYTVRWQAVSAEDGHKTTGALVFSVGNAAQPTLPGNASTPAATQPTQSPTSETPSPLHVFARWIELVSAMLVVGGTVSALLVLHPVCSLLPASAGDHMIMGWRRSIRVALVILAASLAAALLLHVGDVRGSHSFSNALSALIVTRWGLLWTASVGCVLLLLPLLLPAYWRLRPAILGLALVVGGVFFLTWSLISHAAGLASLPILAIAVDWLHLVTASIWTAGVILLTVWLRQARRLAPADRPRVALAIVDQFNRVALVSVAILLATGVYNSLRQIPSAAGLFGTPYGRVLIVKLGLVALALAIGGYHAFMARGQLAAVGQRSRPALKLARRLNGTIGLEGGVIALVLLSVAALIQTPPPVDATAASSPTSVPAAATATTTATNVPATVVAAPFVTSVVTGGLTIDLKLDDQATGTRTFTVTLKDAKGPVSADRVRLRVSATDMDMGVTMVDAVQQTDGLYSAASPVISMSGHWAIDVLVRRRGLEDVTGRFVVTAR